MSGLQYVVEDRKADAVTHLAFARSQNTGNGILGQKNTNDEGSCESSCLFFILKRMGFMNKKWVILVLLMLIILGAMNTKKTYQQEKFESGINGSGELVRVLLKNDQFKGITHKTVRVSSLGGLYVNGRIEKGVYEIDSESDAFQGGTIRIEPIKTGEAITIESIKRACETPTYEGVLDLYQTEEGIVIVNEVELESYLENVVPSEMPATYEMEALKAQAVCARNYVYSHMNGMVYPEYNANVDDSTSFQVYGNAKKHERTSEAVKSTEGICLWYEGDMAVSYFYSTSCGRTAAASANAYLQSIEVKSEKGDFYEEELPWYRWKTSIKKEDLTHRLEQYTGKKIGGFCAFRIEKEEESDRVQKIKVIGTDGEVQVESEYQIRDALGSPDTEIRLQNGSAVDGTELLPSAFFSVKEEKDRILIEGGGYGHGVGMSQNAANEMAKDGMGYKEILKFFYPGTTVY